MKHFVLRSVAAAILGVSVLTACQQVKTTSGGTLGVDRKQYMLVSEQETEQAAAAAYRQELGKANSSGALNTDRKATDRVRRISARLIAQVPVFRADAAKWPWEVNVLKTDELNAYCMAGGKIMVYTGLMDKLKTSDDELAAVLGHEISHALREHSRERISQAYGQQLVIGLVGAAAKLDTTSSDMVDKLFTVGYALPFSRKHETEADLMGLELAARAGYDPRAAVTLWRKMSAAGGGKPPEILSTHPADETRIHNLEAAIPKVMPLYQAAKQRG